MAGVVTENRHPQAESCPVGRQTYLDRISTGKMRLTAVNLRMSMIRPQKSKTSIAANHKITMKAAKSLSLWKDLCFRQM